MPFSLNMTHPYVLAEVFSAVEGPGRVTPSHRCAGADGFPEVANAAYRRKYRPNVGHFLASSIFTLDARFAIRFRNCAQFVYTLRVIARRTVGPPESVLQSIRASIPPQPARF